MHYIPGLRLRVNDRTEADGIDEADMGEFAYDYVGLEPEIRPYTHSTSITHGLGGQETFMMKERQSSTSH